MRFDELIAALDASDDPVADAHRILPDLLGSEQDLIDMVLAADADQLDRVRRVRVKNVEPMVWPLFKRPGHYDVVLNVYDPVRFEVLREQGFITAHRHHFSFASVVLHGGLVHFVYDNTDELDQPQLEPRTQEFVARGGRLLLDWSDYHLVLGPLPLTVTCMVRSAPLFANPFVGDDDYTDSQLAADTSMLLDGLAAARDTIGATHRGSGESR